MKKYLIILIILIVYVLFTIFFLGNKPEIVFLSSPNVKWVYSKGKWSKLDDYKYVKGPFNVYDFENKKYDVSNNIYAEKDNIIVKNKQEKIPFIDSDIFAVKGDTPKIMTFEKDYGVPLSEVEKILKDNNIKNRDYIEVSSISVNLDNDSEIEKIYMIINPEAEESSDGYFSYVYVKDGNNYIKVAGLTSSMPIIQPYSVSKILDFKNDGNYEIILSRIGYSQDYETWSFSMYGLENGKYVELITTN